MRKAFVFALFAVLFTTGQFACAHCDTLDGPVIKAARQALETGNVDLVLAWIQPKDEAEIRSAFARTLEVRKQGDAAKELADMYFFETLVRIHRAGEGFPYTGLKPAGQDPGPAVRAADEAVASGKLEGVHTLMTQTLHEGILHRFHKVLETKDYKPDDVAAGREFVEAYVVFLHYVEGAYETLSKGGHHGAASEEETHKPQCGD